MNQEMIHRSLPIIPVGFLILLWGGCTGHRAHESVLPFETSKQPSEVKELWKRQMPGLITDLNLAHETNSMLVSVIPDYDKGRGRNRQVMLWSSKGKVLWKSRARWPVRSQSIAADGSLAVLGKYDATLQAINQSGRTVWTAKGMCRPYVLVKRKSVLCYHDDDAEPQVAFDVFNWDGKKVGGWTIPEAARKRGEADILAFSVSRDEQNVVIGLTDGDVVLFGKDFNPVWKSSVSGEIADISVSSGPAPRIAVLYTKGSSQRLAVLDERGKLVETGRPESYVRQIEAAPSGDAFSVYGNGPKGQYLALYGTKEMKLLWQRSDSRYADYASSMILRDDMVIIGFEDAAEQPSTSLRRSHLLGFDFEGKLQWNIPLYTRDGAYIYAQTYSSDHGFVGLGTDDGVLRAYRVETPSGSGPRQLSSK